MRENKFYYCVQQLVSIPYEVICWRYRCRHLLDVERGMHSEDTERGGECAGCESDYRR